MTSDKLLFLSILIGFPAAWYYVFKKLYELDEDFWSSVVFSLCITILGLVIIRILCIFLGWGLSLWGVGL